MFDLHLCWKHALVGMLCTKTETVLPDVNKHLRLNGASFATYDQVYYMLVFGRPWVTCYHLAWMKPSCSL